MGVFSRWLSSLVTNKADSGEPVSTPVPSPTDDHVAEYKVFVDAVSQPSQLAQWVREVSWRDDSQSDSFNQFLTGLSPDRRGSVVQMVERAEKSRTLKVLNVIDVCNFRLSRDGVELPCRCPYGLTSLWGSWWCRQQGNPWPASSNATFASIENDD